MVLDATKIAKAVRDRFGVENGLHHHTSDVVLAEDGHIYRNRNQAANLRVFRKIVLVAPEKVETQ